jgi:excisionase family DNA binding protein
VTSRGVQNAHRTSINSRSRRSGDAAPHQKLLTVAQLAERWQVSERTVRRMIADGRIKAVRVGRSVRIPL